MLHLFTGGLDLTYTACARLNEVIGLDWSIYCMLTAHEFLASRVCISVFNNSQFSFIYLFLSYFLLKGCSN